MSLAQRERPYKALTYVNLPGNDDPPYKPGEMIPVDKLIEAGQTDDNIADLLASNAIGDEGDELHPDHRPVDPTIPSLAAMVENAKRVASKMEARGEKVPPELAKLANLDYRHVTDTDKGVSEDANS